MDETSHYRSSLRKREKGSENSFKEIMGQIFPNLGKEMGIQIQEYHLIWVSG